MQIQVKCSCGAEKCPEWAIIEVQGVVEVQPSFQDRLQNLVIGQLCRPSSQVFVLHTSSLLEVPVLNLSSGINWWPFLLQESYTLTIGYHELTGSKVALKKPLLVLKKVKCTDVVQGGDDSGSANKVELDVIGVVRHKILFKNRPKALISSKLIDSG